MSVGAKKRSPRSPESQRKSFGTWSAKVAAAKKKSLERKKGADTLSMMRAEDGSEIEHAPGVDKSVFGIWNRDGTSASSMFERIFLSFIFSFCFFFLLFSSVSGASVTSGLASRGGTPVSSPALTRKSSNLSVPDESANDRLPARSGSQIKRATASDESTHTYGSYDASKPELLKRPNSAEGPASVLSNSSGNLPSPLSGGGGGGGSGKREAAPSTPTNNRRSTVFSTIRAKRSSGRIDDDDSSDSAFPGLSLRSADAAAFLELLKSDKQRKEGVDPEAEDARSKSPSSSPEANSPEVVQQERQREFLFVIS